MGGWLALIGKIGDFYTRLKIFERVFSVEGVPDLKIEIYFDYPEIKSFGWAWKEHRIPDIHVKEIDNNLLILCGAIADLGSFRLVPDSQDRYAEKILELWLGYGEKLIPQINGSFSCLFFSRKTGIASVLADRFSSRSVWISEESDSWIIGNFPSAIASIKKHAPSLNPAGLWSFFFAGRQVGVQCLYSKMFSLLAGQKADLSTQRRISISNWWERKYQPEFGVSSYDWGDILARALKNSAERYKKTCTEPYLFLSGGLDSRVAAASFKAPLKTLTLCTKPNFESRIASAISLNLNLEHKTIIRSPYWYYNTSDASSLISSGIYLNHHTHFIVPVEETISESPYAEFLLGDLLENFNKHYFKAPDRFQLIFTPDNLGELVYNFVPYTVRNRGRIGIFFNKKIRGSVEIEYFNVLRDYASSIIQVSDDHADRFDTFLRWANVGVTPTYNMISCIWPLAKERNLIFDNELNELSLKIPSSLRNKGILHVWILYHLSKMLLFFPDANTFLPPFIPKKFSAIVKRMRPSIGKLMRGSIHRQVEKPSLTTSGSWLLLHEMYRKDSLYRNQIENIIFDKNLFPEEVFCQEQIKKTWNEYKKGNIKLHFEIEILRSFGNIQKLIPCNKINLA